MTTKRDRGDYFKRRRALKKEEVEQLRQEARGSDDIKLTANLIVRLSPKAMTAIDQARRSGMFERSRSEFVRDAVAYYIKAGSP